VGSCALAAPVVKARNTSETTVLLMIDVLLLRFMEAVRP
jgi:hypothetical protein